MHDIVAYVQVLCFEASPIPQDLSYKDCYKKLGLDTSLQINSENKRVFACNCPQQLKNFSKYDNSKENIHSICFMILAKQFKNL
uniref:Uncharacterized protein n=1 Tax=Glossina palpalis gambiensis TaxID=67801 RepID=A0A1B0B1K8_9MUSC